jgi:hypothetical protein
MISRKQLEFCIDDANHHLESVWDAIRGEGSDGVTLIKCQSRLIKALLVLDEQYCLILREQKRLVTNKSRYSQKWFTKEMCRLSRFAKIITSEIGKARALGDGYAWIFYRKDTRHHR